SSRQPGLDVTQGIYHRLKVEMGSLSLSQGPEVAGFRRSSHVQIIEQMVDSFAGRVRFLLRGGRILALCGYQVPQHESQNGDPATTFVHRAYGRALHAGSSRNNRKNCNGPQTCPLNGRNSLWLATRFYSASP